MTAIRRAAWWTPRKGRTFWGVLVLGTGVIGSTAGAAQIPGDELPSFGRVRSEYLTSTYGDVKLLLADWMEFHRERDAVKLARLLTEDALYSPIDGWYVQGRKPVADTIAGRLKGVSNYHVSLIDFTASGGLAYYLGRMRYRLSGDAERAADIAGTFVMVLYLDGRRWRVRSYVERATGDF
jgi:ketosteroid isomerase-like protein